MVIEGVMVILVTEEKLIFKNGEDLVGEFVNVHVGMMDLVQHGRCSRRECGGGHCRRKMKINR